MGLVPEFLRSGIPFANAPADAMTLSVNCADNAGLGLERDEAVIDDPGRTRLLATDALCNEWPVDPTAPDFNEPVQSEIPALVLAAQYDPITPPATTERVAENLSRST